MNKRSEVGLLGISYTGMLSLGLYGAQLGVAWPSIRDTFSLPLDAMGILLTGAAVGFFLSSIVGGAIISRLGAGAHLLLSSLLGVAGLLGFSLSPVWWGVIVASLIAGLCTGGFEVGFNTYIATQHGAREMNWLHAAYGVGSTVSPLLVTTLLGAGLVWRWAYATVAALYLLLSIAIFLTRKQWQFKPETGADEFEAEPDISSWRTLMLPAVWIGVLLFFLYTGTEVATGQWAYSLLTESRGVSEAAAGLWVSIYWGSFTVGRIALGFAGDRFAPVALLRASLAGSVFGAVMLWWNPVMWIGLLGLAVLGLSFASIYPAMLLVTPQRIGAKHAANAIGFQSAAASLGAAALPALAGVLAQDLSLEIVGPFVFGGVILISILHEISVPRGVKRTTLDISSPPQ